MGWFLVSHFIEPPRFKAIVWHHLGMYNLQFLSGLPFRFNMIEFEGLKCCYGRLVSKEVHLSIRRCVISNTHEILCSSSWLYWCFPHKSVWTRFSTVVSGVTSSSYGRAVCFPNKQSSHFPVMARLPFTSIPSTNCPCAKVLIVLSPMCSNLLCHTSTATETSLDFALIAKVPAKPSPDNLLPSVHFGMLAF